MCWGAKVSSLMHSTHPPVQKAFTISWGSTCSLLLLDVNRFILTVPSAFVNHPLHYQPELVRINPEKLTTNTPSLAQHTLLSSWKREFLRLAWGYSLRPKKNHLCWPWPCEPSVKSYWQVLHQNHYPLHNSEETGLAELQQKLNPGACPAGCPP